MTVEVISLKILSVDNGQKSKGVVIRALLGNSEIEHLGGAMDNLCVFSTKTVTEPTTYTKTGAKNSYAKYLLFPSALRRRFKTDGFDFEHLKCGTIEYKENLYVMFEVPRKMPAAPAQGH
jgi:hypothetical protein